MFSPPSTEFCVVAIFVELCRPCYILALRAQDSTAGARCREYKKGSKGKAGAKNRALKRRFGARDTNVPARNIPRSNLALTRRLDDLISLRGAHRHLSYPALYLVLSKSPVAANAEARNSAAPEQLVNRGRVDSQ
jgi:hypothetical protein